MLCCSFTQIQNPAGLALRGFVLGGAFVLFAALAAAIFLKLVEV
jgi:hypothetical protein